MPDVTIAGDWLGKGLAAGLAVVISTATTVFVTRKTNEINLLEKVNVRIDQHFSRQDAEIERLERALREDRERCDEELKELRDQISTLMLGKIPPYTKFSRPRGK